MKQIEQFVEVKQIAYTAADGTIFATEKDCEDYEKVIVRNTPEEWVAELGLKPDEVEITHVNKLGQVLVYSKKYTWMLLFTLTKTDEGFIPAEHLSMSPDITGDYACFRNWRISLDALRMSLDHLSFTCGTAEDTIARIAHFKKMLPYYIKWVGVHKAYTDKIAPLVQDFCNKAEDVMELAGVRAMCEEYTELVEVHNEQAGT